MATQTFTVKKVITYGGKQLKPGEQIVLPDNHSEIAFLTSNGFMERLIEKPAPAEFSPEPPPVAVSPETIVK